MSLTSDGQTEEQQAGSAAGDLEDWRTCWDQSTGNWYFYNLRSGETTWENPYPDAAADVAQKNETGTASVSAEGPSHLHRHDDQVRQRNEDWDEKAVLAQQPVDPLRELMEKTDRVRAALDDGTPRPAFPDTSSPSTLDVCANADMSSSYASSTDFSVDTGHCGGSGTDYTFRALFNKRTGKFQPTESYLGDPRDRFSQVSKAERQCNIYFDYKSWVERQADSSPSAKRRKSDRPKSKKEIETYKARKKEKKTMKQRAWLAD